MKMFVDYCIVNFWKCLVVVIGICCTVGVIPLPIGTGCCVVCCIAYSRLLKWFTGKYEEGMRDESAVL